MRQTAVAQLTTSSVSTAEPESDRLPTTLATQPVGTRHYVPGLNGLRALSALMVMGMHFSALVPFGWVGVQTFYVISGFLITGILVKGRDASPTLGRYLGHFYVRRVRRIVPLYVVYLLVACICAWRIADLRGDLLYLWSLVSYTFNLVRGLERPAFGASLITHLWSLSVEEQFYLFWPLFIFFLPRRWLLPFAVLVVAACPVLRAVLYQQSPDAAPLTIYYVTPFQADAFAIGGVIALLGKGQRTALRWPLLAIAGISLVSYLFFRRHSPFFGFRWPLSFRGCITGYSLVAIVSAVLVLECALESSVARLLEVQPLRYLGRISYGIYVWHLACFYAIEQRLDIGAMSKGMQWLYFLPCTAAVVIVATLSYFSFERPLMRTAA